MKACEALSAAAAGDWSAPSYDEDNRKERTGLSQHGVCGTGV